MSKYNEVMERVEVTPEMKERIFQAVSHPRAAKAQQKKRRLNRYWVSAIGGVAAAAVIMLAVGLFNDRGTSFGPGTSDSQLVQTIYEKEEFASAEELSEAVGFPVRDIESVPFKAEETVYRAVSGKYAYIDMTGEGQDVTFVKSEGTEDNSGDYNRYETEKTAAVQDLTMTIKGENDVFHLALLTDGQYSYSILSESGFGEEDMIRLMQDFIKN